MHEMDLEQMPLEELWALHEQIAQLLSARMIVEKQQLERRLARLNDSEMAGSLPARNNRAPRRPYPKVLPKYLNPLSSAETWSGRGKQPRWLTAALQNGHDLREFEIGRVKQPLPGRSSRVAHR
ncbi:MAG TPA: H-NS histone family protein [Tardiphaga sp.]